jgi:hypothetical protein
MPTYKMLNDNFLSRFRSFMATENNNPAGAFDQAMPKTSPRKENAMPKFRYVPVANAGTSGALYMRQRSTNMAFDDVSHVTEFADNIIQFLRDRISEQDLEQVKDMLKMEAGEKPSSAEEADKMIAGAEARRAGAQDSRLPTRVDEAGFNARFPSARKIGHDNKMGTW